MLRIIYEGEEFFITTEKSGFVNIDAYEKEVKRLEAEVKKLRKQPEPTEFTKIQRNAIILCEAAYEEQEWMQYGMGLNRLAEACDIIDCQAEKLDKFCWIPVSEELPLQGDNVEFLNRNTSEITEWLDYQAKYKSLNKRVRGWFTHWRPIILPPKEALKD